MAAERTRAAPGAEPAWWCPGWRDHGRRNRVVKPALFPQTAPMNRKERRAAAKLGQASSRSPGKPSAAAGVRAAALLRTGVQHQHAGRLADAEACYRDALAAQPDHADALHLLAGIAHRTRRYQLAVDLISQAIKLNGRNPFYFSNLGVALRQLGRPDEALRSFERALALKPDFAEAFINRGNAQRDLKRLDEALASYDQALARQPDHAEALISRGSTLQALGRPDNALACYDRALVLRPGSADAFINRGAALKQLRRLDESLASYDKVLTLRPDDVEALIGRGAVLHELKRLDDALANYDAALALNPDHPEASINRGHVLQDLKRFDEALASYRHAQAVEPDHADAHCGEALVSLLTADFERGWAKNEWRWRSPLSGSPPRPFSQPLWLGAESIERKTILLHSEQGLGDTIQFGRYVPLVAARGARVILEVEEPLRRLMTGLPGVSQCVAKGEPLPDFDLHCPLLSLPLAFATRLETIPAPIPYLAVPRPACDWEARLGTRRPRIGLAWSGNPRHQNDSNRSIGLDALSPLFDIAATFVSAQKDVRPGDQAVLEAQNGIRDVASSLASFADTAALISRLDLVISVDTSVAHLAGALGRPVWILLPFVPDWRWLLDRHDSPWYPTARLFRQTDNREWGDVVARVRDALGDMME